MPCYGCNQKFRDKGGTVVRSSSHSLCYDCMCAALQIYEADPQFLIQLYSRLKDKGIHIPQELITEQVEIKDDLYWNPADRMFNPRSD